MPDTLMPAGLPASPARRLLHTRSVVCQGFERDDGLLDIEGRLTDVSALAAELPFYILEASATLHDMRLTMTVDGALRIHRFHTSTDIGATPFCAQVNQAYAGLEGLRITSGFRVALRERVGGVRGCTHLTEAVLAMANVAVQTLLAAGRERRRLQPPAGQAASEVNQWVMNSCHVYRAGGEGLDRSLPRQRRGPVVDGAAG